MKGGAVGRKKIIPEQFVEGRMSACVNKTGRTSVTASDVDPDVAEGVHTEVVQHFGEWTTRVVPQRKLLRLCLLCYYIETGAFCLPALITDLAN